MGKLRMAALAVGLAIGASACSSSPASTSGSAHGPLITIGSTNFPEQVIIANLYSDVLQHAGFRTDVRADLGTRQAVVPALEAGQLDLEPDYAGSLLNFLNSNAAPSAATQLSTAVPAIKAILGKSGATVLDAAPALDTNVFAVTKATADKYHLAKLSDLASVASQLVLGGPQECPQNYGCLVGLEQVYGLHFKSFAALDEAGPVTVSALKSGSVQVAELFSSDGNILENGFVQLTDDKHLEAADYVIPVIRSSVDTSAVASALNGLSAKLTTDQLSSLNIEVSVNHEDPATVARKWAQKEGLI
ncbi:MAG TPA: ABC transporter substrate-binding protein [Acidimicrobiales bacterium]|nr:ABC transporter substrate-binding protein [Acidimicrobiales bacterium]